MKESKFDSNKSDHLEEVVSHADDLFYMEELANKMAKGIQFDTEEKKMYYFVREPVKDSEQNEGFAKDVTISSQLTDGSICIDGAYTYDMTVGDWCKIDIKPDY